MAKNEVIMQKADWTSNNDWWQSGKGKPAAYTWVPDKGKGKGEKKGKDKGKGKKGEEKGKGKG